VGSAMGKYTFAKGLDLTEKNPHTTVTDPKNRL